MDEEIESLLVRVRADTSTFARDVAAMRSELDGPLAGSVDRAGRVLESSLLRAVRTGRFGFEDLKRVALSALREIAAAAIRSGFGTMTGGKGLAGIAGQLLGGVLGLPGRATGGSVAQGQGYLVGERGPELFVPASSGRIDALQTGRGRDIRMNITINAPAGAEPRALARSSRQVARAVRRALTSLED
jgi:phage-related minor tail protein